MVWAPRALDQLAALCTGGLPRQAVADDAEWRIAADPFGAGESRAADERILIQPPLVVRWRVAPSVGRAFVVSVTAGGPPR